MKRLLSCFAQAASALALGFLVFGCNSGTSTEDQRVDLQVDPLLVYLHRVKVTQLDAQGQALSVLFNDSLTSVERLKNLPLVGYQGGTVGFFVQAYLPTGELIYDITVTVVNGVASVKKNPGAFAYVAALSLENKVDSDGDGYFSRFTLRVDPGTFYTSEQASLKIDRQIGAGPDWAAVGSTALFTIQGVSYSDSRAFTIDGAGLAGENMFRVRLLSASGTVLAQNTIKVSTETALDDTPKQTAFKYTLINQTGAFMVLTIKAGGNTYLDTLQPEAPLNQTSLNLSLRPASIIVSGYNLGLYSVLKDEDRKIIYNDTVIPVAATSAKTDTIVLPQDYLILSIDNNSSQATSKIVLNQGKTTEWSGNYILSAGSKVNFGIFLKTDVLTVHAYSADGTYWAYPNPPTNTDAAWGFSYMSLTMN